MGCAHGGELRVRVDHTMPLRRPSTLKSLSSAHSDRLVLSGPSSPSPHDNTTVQLSSAELLRIRLSALSTVLHNAVHVIEPGSADEQVTQFAELVAAAIVERRATYLFVQSARSTPKRATQRKGGVPSRGAHARQEADRGDKKRKIPKKKEIERAGWHRSGRKRPRSSIRA